jgi:hypothetical protein
MAASGVSFPRVTEIQIRHFAGNVRRIGQPGEFITRREPGDGTSLRHHGTHGVWLEVRTAGRPLGPVEIHRDAQPAVALVFNGFHFPQPHRDIQALLQADTGLSL